MRKCVRRLLGDKIIIYMQSYSDYLLWEIIYKKFLPHGGGLKLVEIGCAPGYKLLKFKERFDYDIYGIEYSQEGVRRNKGLFIEHGINPDKIIYSDFFSEQLHSKYQGFFDIVCSYGFIEHFSESEMVVEKHLELLKKGGFIVVLIPNFKGVNYHLLKFFNSRLLPIHNFDIMDRETFLSLFNKDNIECLYGGYCGVFEFRLFNAALGSIAHHLLAFCHKIQHVLNLLFRLFFRGRGLDNRFLSPYLLFIGKKK